MFYPHFINVMVYTKHSNSNSYNMCLLIGTVSHGPLVLLLEGRGRRENGKYFVVATEGDKIVEREEMNIIREAMMNTAIEMVREKFKREPRECLGIILALQKKAKTERDLAAKNKEGFLVRQGEYVLRQDILLIFVMFIKSKN